MLSNSRRILRLGIPAALLLSGGALAAPAAAAEPSPSGASAHSCSLTEGTLTATAAPTSERNERFADYGDSGVGWTGGDSTYSLELADGRQAWFFSDTFLGPVEADGSRPTTAPFLNNSIVVDDGSSLETVTGGTPDAPASIVGPTGEGPTGEARWHWFGDPERTRRGDVHVPLLQFEKFGPGPWDFRWSANRLAVLDGDTLELERIRELPSSTGINWGAWTMTEGSKTYVYGIADVEGVRSAFVARVTGNAGLAGNWKFWDGKRWSPREADAVPVASHVANEFSVARFEDGYLLVTADTTVPFDTRVVAQTSCSLTGGFAVATELYRMPETGLWGSYGDEDVYGYNAHEHPQLRDGNTLLVTHNVNTFDNVHDIFDDVTIYRPRFWEVELALD
ncbi:DUF4185 domain-containing protein [Agromyces laixinhei]|uniref:DUF4185 domain-containing protein n=1 Tax=Agromyces laixinhei TaxID=2585717 RepID=UPI001116521B|nr:DUF4185 domain-containing protein [Agromyces laixinhei]